MSIVTDTVWIENVTPLSQVGIILASVQSKALVYAVPLLSEENTRALVTAMARVQQVALASNANFDPEFLSAYDGQGRCERLAVLGDVTLTNNYWARIKSWAEDRGWADRWQTVVDNHLVGLFMQRQQTIEE